MKVSVSYIIIFLLLFISSVELNAQNYEEINEEKDEKTKWYVPDYVKGQYAGNIGFIVLGPGYEWWKEIAQTDILYGYVPKSKGNANIHTFTLKNTFRLYQFNIKRKYNLSPIIGLSLSLEPGENSYLRIPGRYPEGYYYTNSFYVGLNIGLKSKLKINNNIISSIEPYVEINTIATYVYYNIVAQEDKEDEIYSLALGANFFF